MVTIIDRTLNHYQNHLTSPHDLIHFCDLLFTSGVTKIELPLRLAMLLNDSHRLVNSLDWGAADFYFLSRRSPGFWELKANHRREVMIASTETLNKLLASPPVSLPKDAVRLTGFADLMSYDYDDIFCQLKQLFTTGLDLCPSNQNHCSTAISLEWLLAGGQEISCAFADHHDFPPLEEVLMGLKLGLPSEFSGDLSVLGTLRSLYEKMTRQTVDKIKPVIGEDIFKVESGIHVDGLLKNPQTYEPFHPETVGNQREIVLGKHSGQQSILYKLKGQNLSETVIHSILNQIKARCTKLGRNLSDLELCALAREVQNEHDAKIYC
jgi:homocitrate synthase NifV